jgi:hypothetical protein
LTSSLVLLVEYTLYHEAYSGSSARTSANW